MAFLSPIQRDCLVINKFSDPEEAIQFQQRIDCRHGVWRIFFDFFFYSIGKISTSEQ